MVSYLLLQLVEFAFRAIGADTAFDPAGHVIESEELRNNTAANAATITMAGGTGITAVGSGTTPDSSGGGGGLFSPAALTIGEEDDEEDAGDEDGEEEGGSSKAKERKAHSKDASRPVLSIKAGGRVTPALGGATGADGNSGGVSLLAAALSPSNNNNRARRGSTQSQPMEMYAHTPGLIHDVVVGVNPTSLPRFLGIMEHRAADILHGYAAHVKDVAETATEAAQAAQAAAAARGSSPQSAGPGASVFLLTAQGSAGSLGPFPSEDARSTSGADVSSAPGSAGGGPISSARGSGGKAAALAATKAAEAETARAYALAAMAALGPPQPPGRTKEALAASTVMTSILIDPAKVAAAAAVAEGGLGGGGSASTTNYNYRGRRGSGGSQTLYGGGGDREGVITPLGHTAGNRPLSTRSSHSRTSGAAGLLSAHDLQQQREHDEVRPLSLAELRAQATVLANNANFKVVKSASKVAATVLSRTGGEGPGGEGW